MSEIRRFAALGAVVVAGITAVASSASLAGGTAGAAGPVSGTFVGKVSHTSAFIAVVAGPASRAGAPRQAVAYICDGRHVSTWFFGQAAGNTLDLRSHTGGHVHATLSAGHVAGTVDVPGGARQQFGGVPARGVAGVYLVNRSSQHVSGFSGLRARLAATVTQTAGGFKISGTVTPRGGASLRLKGPGRFLGSLTQSATWIVLSDGQVTGGEPTQTAGGGNCSIWHKIRSIMSGVFCGFFRD